MIEKNMSEKYDIFQAESPSRLRQALMLREARS